MISRKEEVEKIYNEAEYTIDLKSVHVLVDNLVDTIKTLENIVDEAIRKPLGVEPHSWSDYKSKLPKDKDV